MAAKVSVTETPKRVKPKENYNKINIILDDYLDELTVLKSSVCSISELANHFGKNWKGSSAGERLRPIYTVVIETLSLAKV